MQTIRAAFYSQKIFFLTFFSLDSKIFPPLYIVVFRDCQQINQATLESAKKCTKTSRDPSTAATSMHEKTIKMAITLTNW